METKTTNEQPEAGAGLAAATGSARPWTKKECLDGIWEMYRECCKLETKQDKVESTRYPDFEDMLRQLERHGLPANCDNPPKSPTPWLLYRTGDKLSVKDGRGKFVLRKTVNQVSMEEYARLCADLEAMVSAVNAHWPNCS